MTNRLFIALNIPQLIKDNILEIRNTIYGLEKNVRWEKDEKLHLTLKFLGDVETTKNEEILFRINSLVERHKKFELNLDKFGLFYRNKKPSILWLGFKHSKELLNIVSELDEELEQLNFKKERRKYKTHLTLIRLRGKENISKIKKFLDYQFPALNFEADTISLIKSTLNQSGSVYSNIKSFKLI